MPSRVSQSQDTVMPDSSSIGHDNAPSQESIIDLGEQRIRVVSKPTVPRRNSLSLIRPLKLPGASDTAASFEFEGEDHTLGNALRYMIMKNPEVEFCGYSIPHPSEAKMNVRIQTYEGTNVYDALEKGLDDLRDLCDVVTDKFTLARDAFAAKVS